MTYFYLILPIMGVLFILIAAEHLEELVRANKIKKEGFAE